MRKISLLVRGLIGLIVSIASYACVESSEAALEEDYVSYVILLSGLEATDTPFRGLSFPTV